MRFYLTVAVLLFIANVSQAAELADTSATRNLSDKAAALIAEGKIKEAFESFQPYWPLPSHEVEALIHQAQSQRGQISTRFGKSISIEHVTTEAIGNVFIRDIYLEKHEHHAIAWIFTYYRPMDKWIVNRVIFSAQLEPLFK